MDTKLAPKSSRRKKPEAPARPAPRWPYDGPMTWQDVMEHPALRDLPFHIEQDAWGRIVMSPVANMHARRQGEIAYRLREQLGGEAYPEAPIATPEGTKVPDVVWMPKELAEQYAEEDVLPVAPPICVEVRSPSNPDVEMAEKVMLYLAKGAKEVWICDLEGNVSFHSHEGSMEHSALAPDFPARIDL